MFDYIFKVLKSINERTALLEKFNWEEERMDTVLVLFESSLSDILQESHHYAGLNDICQELRERLKDDLESYEIDILVEKLKETHESDFIVETRRDRYEN